MGVWIDRVDLTGGPPDGKNEAASEALEPTGVLMFLTKLGARRQLRYAYSEDMTAAKRYYVLLQIAQLIQQAVRMGGLLVRRGQKRTWYVLRPLAGREKRPPRRACFPATPLRQ